MLRYAGFWARFWAALIDTALLMVIMEPVLVSAYGWEYFDSTAFVQGPIDFLVTWVFPAIVVIVFWIFKSATPGKMAIGARIVDARTGGKPSTGQLIGRYLAYYISTLALLLGFIWVAFDPRKQGWHDRLAGTLVVRNVAAKSDVVEFDRQSYSSAV